MQTADDPNFYLKHAFDKSYSDYGVPYIQENCLIDNCDNIVVYGHNMNNGSMFADLCKFEDEEFYKEHKRTFQYGRFEFVAVDNPNQLSWQIKGNKEIIAGLFQTKTSAAPYRDRISIPSAHPSKQYSVECVKQSLRIKSFGPLINHITPVRVKTDGALIRAVDKHFSMLDGTPRLFLRREHYHSIPLMDCLKTL